jgi:hypothetical protein
MANQKPQLDETTKGVVALVQIIVACISIYLCMKVVML